MFGVFYFINKWEVFVFVVGGNILFGVRKKKLESFRKVFKFNIKFFFFLNILENLENLVFW